MSIQQAVHICLSIPLYDSTRSFQFINTCEENNRAFHFDKMWVQSPNPRSLHQ